MRAHLRKVGAVVSAAADTAPAPPKPSAGVTSEQPPPFDWRALDLLIAVPVTVGAGIDPRCVGSLFSLQRALWARGARTSFTFARGYGVCVARDLIARVFLESGATHLLQVDADTEVAPEAVIRMLEQRVDVIGLPVRIKRDGELYNVGMLGDGSLVLEGQRFRVKAVGTAVFLTTRSAIERVGAISRRYKWGPNRAEVVGVFEEIVVDGEKFLDDTAFAIRAHQVGLDIWALFNGRSVHHGEGLGLVGDFGAVVTANLTPEQQLAVKAQELRVSVEAGPRP